MAKRNIKKSLAEALEIPDEIALDSVRLIITGSGRLQAENHKGIIEYLPGKIVFKTAEGQVEVVGRGLSLAALSLADLCIEGDILALNLVREGEADEPR